MLWNSEIAPTNPSHVHGSAGKKSEPVEVPNSGCGVHFDVLITDSYCVLVAVDVYVHDTSPSFHREHC